eukprot:COSAG02_NODE_2360_length_9063_cov_19.715529_13_plen_141_part_00
MSVGGWAQQQGRAQCRGVFYHEIEFFPGGSSMQRGGPPKTDFGGQNRFGRHRPGGNGKGKRKWKRVVVQGGHGMDISCHTKQPFMHPTRTLAYGLSVMHSTEIVVYSRHARDILCESRVRACLHVARTSIASPVRSVHHK